MTLVEDTSLRAAILLGERDVRGSETPLTDAAIAQGMGLRPSRYCMLKHPRHPATPTLAEALAVASYFDFPIEEVIGVDMPDFLDRSGPIAWRRSGSIRDAGIHAQRLAAVGVLAGVPPAQIAKRIRDMRAGRGLPPEDLDLQRLGELAMGGLTMGFVELVLSENRSELEDEDLAEELRCALREASPSGFVPVVRVARDVAHPDFAWDPAAPFLAALIAHSIVADFLQRHRAVTRVGLAGGPHCLAFAASAERAGSPFPDPWGNRRLSLYPLALEPFSDLDVPLAVSVVSRMAEIARLRLGQRHVEAFGFQPIVHCQGDAIGRIDDGFVSAVQAQYRRLEVAIYGCGDLSPDGWLARMFELGHVRPGARAVTELFGIPLGENGEPTPSPDGRRLVGMELPLLGRMASRPDRLALLLATGTPKGLPITVLARAGYAGVIVCDQAAARAALGTLREERVKTSARPAPQKVQAGETRQRASGE
jgi:hypothetical protein